MSEFEKFADLVTRDLLLSKRANARVRSEIISHLEDEYSVCREQGVPEDEARQVAIKRFGEEEAMSKLFDDSLRTKQQRFRRLSAMYLGVLSLLVVGAGAAFNIFDDSFSRMDFPKDLQPAIYLSALIGTLIVLSLLAAILFKVRFVPTIFATISVALTFVFAVMIVRATPAREIFVFEASDDDFTRAWIGFFMRLYFCWCPTLIVVVSSLFVVRDRTQLRGSGVCLGIGLISAILWGTRNLGLGPMKWPKLLSTGLLAAVFVVLVWLVVRTLAKFRCFRH